MAATALQLPCRLPCERPSSRKQHPLGNRLKTRCDTPGEMERRNNQEEISTDFLLQKPREINCRTFLSEGNDN